MKYQKETYDECFTPCAPSFFCVGLGLPQEGGVLGYRPLKHFDALAQQGGQQAAASKVPVSS